MDYQGNYFPDDEDERESKTYKRVKGVFKWTMYGLSFVVYALLFYFLFVNRDRAVLEKNYMTEVSGYTQYSEQEIELLRINPREFMNYDGSLQVYNVDYAEALGLLELGLKFNANKLTGGDKGDVIDFVFSDSEGNEYPLAAKHTDSGGRYGFARVCFSGVKLDLDSNDLQTDKTVDSMANELSIDDPDEFEEAYNRLKRDFTPKSDVTYTLSVYFRREDGERTLLHEFVIYDNSVVYYATDYNKG